MEGGSHTKFVPVPIPVIPPDPVLMQESLRFSFPNTDPVLKRTSQEFKENIETKHVQNIQLPNGTISTAQIIKFPSKEKYLIVDTYHYKLDPITEIWVPIDPSEMPLMPQQSSELDVTQQFLSTIKGGKYDYRELCKLNASTL